MISNEPSKAPGRLDAEKLPSELMTNFGVGPLSCAGTYLRDDSVISHVPTTAVFVWVQPIRTSTANTQSPNRVAIRTNYETPISERLLPIQMVSAVLITPGGLNVKERRSQRGSGTTSGRLS